MERMEKMKKSKFKRAVEVVLSAACVLAVIIFAYADNNNSRAGEVDDTSDVPVIESSVTIGKKTYTKDRPLKVIEIVPLEFQRELAYLIGSDYYGVKFEDIKELIVSGNPNAKGFLQSWAMNLGSMYGGQYSVQFYVKFAQKGGYGWCDGFPNNDYEFVLDNRLDYRIIDNDGNVYRYKDENGNVVNSTNIFAYSVFNDYNMADKIEYEAKCPSELTQKDIDEADLIYINTAAGYRDGGGGCFGIYKTANSYMPGKYPMIKNGITYDTKQTFSDRGEDFSADIAWYLYRAIVAEDIAIIFDTNRIANYFETDDNAVKLSYLLNGVDRDMFKEHFWKNENVAEKSYSGTLGNFEIVNDTFKITYTYYNQYDTAAAGVPNKELSWHQQMFINADFVYSICHDEGNEDNKNYYYYAPDFSGHERSVNVWNNVFSYGDWNTLLQQVPAGNLTIVNKEMAGSSYDDLYYLFGDNGKVSVGSAIRYILGDYLKLNEKDGSLKVLEIEPAGSYQYDNLTDEQALKIFNYLQISISNIKGENIAGYVDIKSVAMNEFIAMTEDIKNNYDLVIIGDWFDSDTNKNYKNTFLKYTYSEYGKEILYYNLNPATKNIVDNISTVYSGNDLTDKAYDKLKDYLDSKKPMVLADSIYSGDTNVIDKDSNVYKLSKLAGDSKYSKYITDESMKLGGRLKCIERPSVIIDKNYDNVIYDDDGIAKINLTRNEISNFGFSVSTGNDKRNYNLEIYVDKNGDGLFSGSGENNEIVYKGEYQSYTQRLTLPSGLRGYLKWKVVLTDKDTGMSTDKEGAFVVGYGNNEKKVVKVLQIGPEGNTLPLNKNDSFLKLFDAASEITGLQMTADDITVMTTTEFEQWYESSPYDSNTKANDKLSKDGETGFDIIVMGFEDSYGYEDIDDTHGALSNIYDYIEAGNSVLMSHDLVSYSAYSDSKHTNVNVSLKSNDLDKVIGWSYNITSKFRNMIGMDRYGVAVDENKNTESPYGAGLSNSLNLGKVTYDGNNNTNYARYNSVGASQVNSGQINMYPYNIGERVDTSVTHAQYFQLDLNSDDIVVWYALSDDRGDNPFNYFSMSGNDALNNYYIYSKGNITYTGAGHSKDLGESGIELKLFVNTIIKAIGSANSIPVVEFDNAVRIDNYLYEMTIRDDKLPETITFTVTDKDFLGDTNGTFSEAFVYFDVDGDNKYIEGTDILLAAYDDDEATPIGYLKNMTPETLDFAGDTGIVTQWKNSGDSKLLEYAQTIEEAFENNELRIKVQVKDNNNGIGRGTLNIVNKQLFNLN